MKPFRHFAAAVNSLTYELAGAFTITPVTVPSHSRIEDCLSDALGSVRMSTALRVDLIEVNMRSNAHAYRVEAADGSGRLLGFIIHRHEEDPQDGRSTLRAWVLPAA